MNASVCEFICFCSKVEQLLGEEINMAETFRRCSLLPRYRQLHVDLASLCWECGTAEEMVKPPEQ